MQQIKKEYVWLFYLILIIVLGLLGYFFTKNNNLEYGLAGSLLGVLLSLILWVIWGSKNTY
jgi:hypothetical protein